MVNKLVVKRLLRQHCSVDSRHGDLLVLKNKGAKPMLSPRNLVYCLGKLDQSSRASAADCVGRK